MTKDESLIIDGPQNMLQIYFSGSSPLHDINVKADSVDKIVVEGGFLKVHDIVEKGGEV